MIGVDLGNQQRNVGSIRWLRELLTMVWPACANAASISPATDESSPEKTSLRRATRCRGIHHELQRRRPAAARRAAMRCSVAIRACPRDRWLAPSQLTRNHGWFVEERDELLADHAGRAEDTDGIVGIRVLIQKSRRGKPCRRTFWLVGYFSQRSSTTPPTGETRFLRPSRFRASEMKFIGR